MHVSFACFFFFVGTAAVFWHQFHMQRDLCISLVVSLVARLMYDALRY